MRSRKMVKAVIVIALVILSGACRVTPIAPTPTPTPAPPAGPVMAPPPAGVSAEVWKVGFVLDGRLRRPQIPGTTAEAVHLDVSAFPPDVQERFAAAAAAATEFVHQKTSIDVVPGGAGATIKVVLNYPTSCGGGACTGLRYDLTGRVTGGTIEFESLVAMQSKLVLLHEILRTLGIMGGVAPRGIMALSPQSPTAEDTAMVLGRYNYPLLAVYAPQ